MPGEHGSAKHLADTNGSARLASYYVHGLSGTEHCLINSDGPILPFTIASTHYSDFALPVVQLFESRPHRKRLAGWGCEMPLITPSTYITLESIIKDVPRVI